MALLTHLGAKSWPPFAPVTVVVLGSQGNSERRRHPYKRGPDRAANKAFTELARDLVGRGRAAGYIVKAATQKPSADTLRRAFGPDGVTVVNVLEEPPGSRGPDRVPRR